MPQPDPTACCPDAYYCPASASTVCPRHHHRTPCGPAPHEHTPMDIEAWHRAHDRIEEALLDAVFRHTRNAGHGVEPRGTLGGVLDDVLGAMTPSTLGAVHAVTAAPVG